MFEIASRLPSDLVIGDGGSVSGRDGVLGDSGGIADEFLTLISADPGFDSVGLDALVQECRSVPGVFSTVALFYPEPGFASGTRRYISAVSDMNQRVPAEPVMLRVSRDFLTKCLQVVDLSSVDPDVALGVILLLAREESGGFLNLAAPEVLPGERVQRVKALRPAWYEGPFWALPLLEELLLDQGRPGFRNRLAGFLASCIFERLRANENTGDKRVIPDNGAPWFAAVRDSFDEDLRELVVGAVIASKVVLPMKYFALNTVLQHPVDVVRVGDGVLMVTEDAILRNSAEVPVAIIAMTEIGNTLRIALRYSIPLPEEVYLGLCVRGEGGYVEHRLKAVDRGGVRQYFGQNAGSEQTYEITVPLSDRGSFEFRILFSDESRTAPLRLNFTRAAARLANIPNSYWLTGNRLFFRREESVTYETRSAVRIAKAEVDFQSVGLRGVGLKRRVYVGGLRALAFLDRGLRRGRKSWIFYDKLYKAGDNGEYSIKAALRKRDGFRKYYILNGDSPDWARLRGDVPVLKFGTIRQKVAFLNCDLVAGTHISPQSYGSFFGGGDDHFRGLFRYKFVDIQHGLTVQNLEATLNRNFDDTRAYCLASPVEHKNLTQEGFGYNESQLHATGLARFDALTDVQDGREIIIAPTWRSYLAAPAQMGKSRGKAGQFTDTLYYKTYSSILSNPDLIESARKGGYRIRFILHPVTSSQRDDFSGNDVVSIESGTDFRYEEELQRTSVLVTDYSGIQFDVAVMGKPIVYFHHPEIPPSYDSSVFDYEKDGLGPIVDSEEDLVRVLCSVMDGSGDLGAAYGSRREAFFYFQDHRNGERVYDVLRSVVDEDGS